ncbi:hypothetical protein LCGC14_0353260 [marine sediment metagenome]|uniref:Uncharacterized protein n=1 Tax=marine sediment metagenome TaxID=412755 RepID=A0A0F9TFN4_9ZZZZ
MAQTQIRVIPIDTRGRGRLDRLKLTRDLKAAMIATTANGQRFIARYPAQRLTKSNYRRTGTLKRSWSSTVQVSGSRMVGIVGSNSNIAPYNRFVQGTPKEVVKMFPQAGWKGVDDLDRVLENELNKRVFSIMEAFVR